MAPGHAVRGVVVQWMQRYQRAAAGAIYGTIVTAAVVAGESIANVSVSDVAWSVAVTVPIYWLAHVYAVVLAGRLPVSARPTRSDVREALREELVILDSAVPPLVLLVVLRAAGAAASTAIAAALWSAVIDLFLFGYAAASRNRLAVGVRVVYAVVAALFGIAIIVLKIALH